MSITFHYAHESTGAYLGSRDEDLPPPPNSIVVPTAPDHASQIWNGSTWGGFDPPQPQNLTLLLAVNYAIYNDPDVPWQLLAFMDAIRYGGNDSTLRKAVWARLKADNPDWLTPALKTKFVAWSVAAEMPVE